VINYHIYAVCSLHAQRRNVIEEWIASLGKESGVIAADLRVRLTYLREQPRDGWEMPMYRQTLQGYSKIGEVRLKVAGKQIRVFGFFGPFQSMYTLLGGAIEKGRQYDPKDAIAAAEKRRQQVLRRERSIEKFKVAIAE
jgi:hypothetical protein